VLLPHFVRNAHLWLPGYLVSVVERRSLPSPSVLWVTIADHYEPYWRGADHATARQRVQQWYLKWPQIAARYRDSVGAPPKYTCFYAEEEYHPDLLDQLAELTEQEILDVEIHLHHDNEPADKMLDRMEQFKYTLHHRHGLLHRVNDQIVFGFIHGNWALDNSRPDGRHCGLNNELTLLNRLGCYADFTLPSAPGPAQTKIINKIYWATDDPDKPRSHDRGVPVRAGVWEPADLLIVPGPLGWSFSRSRKRPHLETGEIAAHDPVSDNRVQAWLRLAPQIGTHLFLKLFTHGTQEPNSEYLLTKGLDNCLEGLHREADRRRIELRFASAWEMRIAIEAAATMREATINGLGELRTST